MRVDVRDPRTQKIILGALFVMGAGYYYFMSQSLSFTYRSRQVEIGAMREQRDQLKEQIARARKNANRLEALTKEKDALAREWLALEAQLPTKHDEPEFLAEVTQVGRSANLDFLSFEPRPVEQHEFYSEVPVELRLEGGYHRVGSFLAALDNLQRVVRITSLKLAAHPEAEDEKEVPTVTAEMTLSAFFLEGSSDGGGTAPSPETPVRNAAAKGTRQEQKTKGEET